MKSKEKRWWRNTTILKGANAYPQRGVYEAVVQEGGEMKCKHRKLYGHRHNFIDAVSGKTVFSAECKCGKTWNTDSRNPWLGFRVAVNGGSKL